eukprot:scaffold2012_cov193-Cylindrotheca_fusiformis.AAC.8
MTTCGQSPFRNLKCLLASSECVHCSCHQPVNSSCCRLHTLPPLARMMWRQLIAAFIFLAFNQTYSLSSPSRERPRIPVLSYQDDWVCVNKPHGLTVHRSKSTPKHQRVLTTMVKKQLTRKVFPVHRLDHRTSGAILFAFDSDTAGRLHQAAVRNGNKQYIALVRGEWKNQTTVLVDKPIRVKNITKDATTRFTLLASSSPGQEERCSMLLCEPLTGRTHQIRRHAFAIGHPILGDTQHGDSRVNRYWREKHDWDRLALHSWKLEFELDETRHDCISPLPLQFQIILRVLELWDHAVAKEPLLSMEEYDETGGSHGRHYRSRKDRLACQPNVQQR